MDPLEGVFVFCFVFGVAISLFSFALGAIGGGHGGHGDAHGLHGGHVGAHGAIGDGGHGIGSAHGGGGNGHAISHGGAGDHGALHEGHASEISPFNLTTITAFMAFFGGSGWVLYGSMGLGAAVALIASTVVGVAGGAVVFWFLVKVLVAGQTFMDPTNSRIEGAVAHVTIAMQDDGIGEIVFSREGARRSEGARSATGAPIARGTEVVIVRYEGGLAYVEPWATYVGES
jgi:hypothetical protein